MRPLLSLLFRFEPLSLHLQPFIAGIFTAPKLIPLVTYSPVYSTLVVKAGTLHRQSTVLKSWKKCVVVLTIDGFLHVFDTAQDLLLSEEELAKISGIHIRCAGAALVVVVCS